MSGSCCSAWTTEARQCGSFALLKTCSFAVAIPRINCAETVGFRCAHDVGITAGARNATVALLWYWAMTTSSAIPLDCSRSIACGGSKLPLSHRVGQACSYITLRATAAISWMKSWVTKSIAPWFEDHVSATTCLGKTYWTA